MTSDLSEFLPYRLFQAAEITSRDFQRHYEERYGMLRTEWRVLFHLGRSGKQTAKQIGGKASLHKTKVSRAVKALEIKRFLQRETDENDRRSEFLSLTKRGQTVMTELTEIALEYDQNLKQRIGAENHAALVESLDQLISRMVAD